jgi:hypothetical protein
MTDPRKENGSHAVEKNMNQNLLKRKLKLQKTAVEETTKTPKETVETQKNP